MYVEGAHALIAGGAGFVGSNLARRLLDRGMSVTCVDDFSTGQREHVATLQHHPTYRFLQADVCDADLPKRMQDTRIDWVFHLACPTGVPNIAPLGEAMLRSSAIGTENLLTVARDHDARMVFASSCEIYGKAATFPQHEAYEGVVDPVGPRSAYEEGKRFAEALVTCHVQQRDVDARIVRIFNTYGAGMSLTDMRVVPRSVRRALQGRSLVMYGNGLQTRTHLYIDDLLDALVLVMTQGSRGGVYNAGGTRPLTIEALYGELEQVLDTPLRIRREPHFIEDHTRRLPDTRRLQALGWRQSVPIREGLRRTVENVRDRLETRAA